ncbi:SecY-interacting protein Syd [Massilia pseudoviolaceinigra]|uniref:SecY-interacting protein Syd n=1 Tax=Massilia pseudoviolaceinigra TaxID=3057165 RepID=UPI002796DADE|nr:SecY-interacting protein Syd [Massilia sp. CCM 9206]MDQ1922186.1 SecY-interacting protein Syd [Massilia sp. CCM 9206]
MNEIFVKDALERLFKQFEYIADHDLPMLPIVDGASSEIFVGDADSEGWIRWRPKVKNEFFDLSELEKNANIRIHDSIKVLLNSWWFGYLSVKFSDCRFDIDTIIPGNYKVAFLQKLIGYRAAHQGRLDYIPIGMEVERDLLLVVKNSSGEICVEDFSVGSYQIICESLPKFFVTCSDNLN